MNFLLGILAALFIIAGVQTYRLDKLQSEAKDWRPAIAALKETNEENQIAILECKTEAEENIARAQERMAISREAARGARLQNRELEDQLERRNEQLLEISDQVAGSCPVMRDPVYIDFLCSGPLGCSDS